ncbi:hypothetical protein TIFTF001_029042 [Ficus carica]|uniref:Uncharacterized protein n=1 Tax=Ficus carica TaxID=3494 RepID=A0AA88DQU2_FICCA|nr:hypothetical protein TIFTF001_029042 [Ficus carica]
MAVSSRLRRHPQISPIGSLEASWQSLVESSKHNATDRGDTEGRSIVASGRKPRVEAVTVAKGLVAGLVTSLSPCLNSSIASQERILDGDRGSCDGD